jgi:uncharacterized protein (DUF924 family)
MLQSYHLNHHVSRAIHRAVLDGEDRDGDLPMNSNPRLPTLAMALAIGACMPLAVAAAGAQELSPVTASEMQTMDEAPAEASAVVAFWWEAGSSMWFAKDPEFDALFRERFLDLHEAAARHELNDWLETPEGALALVILLDQFPRNAFRDSPHMYATDAHARAVADRAIAAGYDLMVADRLALFFYLPFGHSEDLADQERSVALAERLGERDLQQARHHRDIVARFGRFPHRNPILGRDMTADEREYLENGGYAG